MGSPDDDGEWDDPPLPADAGDRAAAPWPSNGLASAAWAGWLAVAYGLVGSLRAVTVATSPAVIGLLGIGLLVGVRLGGGDPRVWR
ncbi:hypothetical protein BRC89_07030 [Halobacteriales archaeon QS_4_70_19]|nr:MAG: hypothetical protein BRC89_07030 [Halobacteriales archaeon QS_4_70_19]